MNCRSDNYQRFVFHGTVILKLNTGEKIMEYIKRCNVCGHIFCYTDRDVKESDKNKIISGISDLGATAGVFGGHWGATLANQNNANRYG